MGTVKQYNEEDGKFGKVAEQVVQNWLINNGYSVTPLPHGNYKWDCLAESELEKAYVEVERRNSWADGKFPFPTVHVPVRRYKSGDAWLFVVRRDLNAALVAFFRYLLSSDIIELPNKFVSAGEEFYNVPVAWCLPIDMEDKTCVTIAERNRKRVLAMCKQAKNNGGTIQYRKHILGPLAPYGMNNTEWNTLLDELTDEDLPRRLRKAESQPRLF